MTLWFLERICPVWHPKPCLCASVSIYFTQRHRGTVVFCNRSDFSVSEEFLEDDAAVSEMYISKVAAITSLLIWMAASNAQRTFTGETGEK